MLLDSSFAMLVWFLCFLCCFKCAIGTNGELPRRNAVDKHRNNAASASILPKRNLPDNGTRIKRTPSPRPQPQIIIHNAQIPSANDISKRQFLPIAPDLQRREFAPRSEFDSTLLPTPRLIRPLDIEPRRFHMERLPIDLEHRPFFGQGLLGPRMLPNLHNGFPLLENQHRPLLSEVPHEFPLPPELEQRHELLEPHPAIMANSPHLMGDPLHFGSLGDAPLLNVPRRHHFAEGFMAPEMHERLPENLELQPHHNFRENLASIMPRHFHPIPALEEEPHVPRHLQEPIQHQLNDNFDQNADSIANADENTEGDDTIEGMMNELNQHRSKKTWVTDVNIYDKKKKMDDLANFLDSDDADDDGGDPCSNHPCKNGGVCRPKDGGEYECLCTRSYKGKHCAVRNRCFPNPCHNHGRCTETISGFECSCAIGYKGTQCLEKNHCLPNPCLNDGECNESPDGFICSCKENFQGKSCEVKRTACNPNPCLNNAQCVLDSSTNYRCICTQGFIGRTCDSASEGSDVFKNSAQRSDIAFPTASIACINNPCMNNALCQPDSTSERGFRCACAPEYKGILCEEKQCKCENNGFCVNDGGQSKCICKAGFAGSSCEKRIQCNEDTCLHGGVCMEEIGTLKCKCEEGYKGDRCEVTDRCSPNPCLHGGTCKDIGDSYHCECPKTYKGKQCEDFNFCFPNPCLNGGTCYGYPGGFQCDCQNGFSGKNCETKQYCVSNPCKNGGQCVEVQNSFKCLCDSGFSGGSCEVRNFCANNPCKNGATCQNSASGFKCTCTEQFVGDRCDTFNRCFESPCKNGGTCEMKSHGDVSCTCTVGFMGPTCEQTNECQPNPCQNGGMCLNSAGGGFTCSCKEGFRGLTCLDVDPCHPNPCSHGICSEINGGYVCNCTLGFRGPVCAEVDRCSPNPCYHGAVCEEINGGVGYVCQCPVGYKGQVCDMKDPCNPSPCQHDGKCLETVTGSGYTCTCAKGWMGAKCEDSNPCFPNPCQHGGNCQNDGNTGVKCNCSQGFKGTRCEKIDLCSPNPCRFGSHCIQTDEESYQCVKNLCTPNPCKHSGKCIVVNDEGYECACASGWRGKNCEDYDPCFSTPCLNGGTCTENSSGGITCLCKREFQGKYCEGTKQKPQVQWCSSQPCTNGGTCIDTDGAFTCRCPLGFSGPVCEESVCLPNPCENGGTCVPYYGIALCRCTHDYRGAHCSDKRRFKTEDAAANVRVTTKSPNTQYNIVPASPSATQLLATQTGSTRQLTVEQIAPQPVAAPPIAAQPVAAQSVAAQPVIAQSVAAQSAAAQPVVAQQIAAQSVVAQPVAAQSVAAQTAAAQLISSQPTNTQPVAALQVVSPVLDTKHAFPETASSAQRSQLMPMSNVLAKKDEICDAFECLHHGLCVVRTDNQPECICGPDFSGPRCGEIGAYGYSSAPKFFPKDECNHCDKNAICVNSHCVCKPDYTGDGLECWAKTDRDRQWTCDQNPCQNGGTCKASRSRCVCRLGYTGDYCQNYCPPVVHLSFDKMQGTLAKDETGNNNDAMLINGAEIIYEEGKCDSGVSLLGGDILFDGERFWPKPVEAITMALWLKLDTNKGIQSVFDTVGDKFSSHKEGQYHLEIENGKIRWFHRNEKHNVVFSIISSPLVGEGTWNHIAATYSAQKAIAKIFLNGDLVADGPGNGYLSQDWTGKAGIGKHEHPYGNRLLRGMVDEFFIFNCPLPRLEVLVLMHHCRLYFGKKKDYSQSQQPKLPQAPAPLTPSFPDSSIASIPNMSQDRNNQPRINQDLAALPGLANMMPKEKINFHLKDNEMVRPADHWVYTVAEKMHVGGDLRGDIVRPSNQQNMQPNYQLRQQQQQQIATSRNLPPHNKTPQGISKPYKSLAQFQQPHTWPQYDHSNAQQSLLKQIDYRALWNEWKKKKLAEEAKKRELEKQNKEEHMIEQMYNSLFGKSNQAPMRNEIQSNIAQMSKFDAISKSANGGTNNPLFLSEQEAILPKQPAAIQRPYAVQLPAQSFYPEYTSSDSQKKNNINYLMRETPKWAMGASKSSIINPKSSSLVGSKPKPAYNYAQFTSIPNAMATRQLKNTMNTRQLASSRDPSSLLLPNQGRPMQQKPWNNFQSARAKIEQQQKYANARRKEIQMRMEKYRQAMNMRNSQQKASQNPMPINPISRAPKQWPKPNFVKEYTTNRGVVRVQSLTRPMPSSLQPAHQSGLMQFSSNRNNQRSPLKDPWSVYRQMKALQSSKRQNYQQGHSDAHSATSSNTMEGATAPGQQGAGHNYGYGYGYGTGNEHKGGGFGQGYGGGGPGENTAGNHHIPDFSNPNMDWGHGKGWGQGGKGVPQQEQYKPQAPSGMSFFPQNYKQFNTPVRQNVPYVPGKQWNGPKGPSIMNFEQSHGSNNNNQKQQMGHNLLLRGSTPVSSPAYQVKYYMSNNGMIGQSDSERSLRNEIISNAIADALRSIQKKKKRTTKGERR